MLQSDEMLLCTMRKCFCALLLLATMQTSAAAQPADNAQVSSAMTNIDLQQQAATEITRLHDFFQAWYRGELEATAFSSFEHALDESFQIITPDGNLLPRERILHAVRQQAGSDASALLEIRHVEPVAVDQHIAVFRYQEWQSSTDEAPRGRLSTVVFQRDDEASNGLIWLQVHETWLPE